MLPSAYFQQPPAVATAAPAHCASLGPVVGPALGASHQCTSSTECQQTVEFQEFSLR